MFLDVLAAERSAFANVIEQPIHAKLDLCPFFNRTFLAVIPGRKYRLNLLISRHNFNSSRLICSFAGSMSPAIWNESTLFRYSCPDSRSLLSAHHNACALKMAAFSIPA
jgi:hypothetical protein